MIRIKMFYMIAGLILILSGSSNVYGVNFSPVESCIKLYEPYYWQFGSDAGDALISRVAGDNYIVLDRYKVTQADRNAGTVGTCEAGMFDVLYFLSGITFISTHGNGTGLIYSISADLNHAETVQEWIDTSLGSEYMTFVTTGSGYCAMPSLDYYEYFWQEYHNENKSIVHLLSCLANGPLGAAIGGLVLGYIDLAYPTGTAISDIEKLYGRMNGSLDDGDRRSASDALAANDYSFGFQRLGGSSNMTLCPAPVGYGPNGTITQPSGISGIELDTYCDAVEPSTALTITKTGNVTIDNPVWSGDSNGVYQLYFCYSASENDHFTINVTAHANNIVARDNKWMDGGDVSWSFSK